MVQLIDSPTRIEAPGTPPKIIREYIGRVNSRTAALSMAHMISPAGWTEPAQTPDFDEHTVVLRGSLRVETESGVHDVNAGQGIIVPRAERVRYSTPGPEGAEYITVCLPAFSPETVHREAN
ncbi:MAG: cupin [Verrucomicrobiota bacterium]|nr:cupin [Verrucomicrobiota bacterium]